MNKINSCKLPFFYRDAAAAEFFRVAEYIPNYYQPPPPPPTAACFRKFFYSLSPQGKVYRIGGGGGGWWRLCNFQVSFPFELPPPLCNLRRWRRWRRWRLGFSAIKNKFYMTHIYLYKIHKGFLLPQEGVPALGLYRPLISLCAFVLSLTVLL